MAFPRTEVVAIAIQYRVGLCVGIVVGVSRSAQSVNRACLPKGVSLVQAVKVVIAYADAVPELTHLPFVVLAAGSG